MINQDKAYEHIFNAVANEDIEDGDKVKIKNTGMEGLAIGGGSKGDVIEISVPMVAVKIEE